MLSLAAVGVGLTGQSSPPDVPRAPAFVAGARSAPGPDREVAQDQEASAAPIALPVSGPVLPRSRPVSVTISSIDAQSPQVVELGLDETRAMEVPQNFDLAGWYRHGPAPGELGPAVLAGHVDSRAGGPAGFFHLGEFVSGQEVPGFRHSGAL